MQKEKIAQIYNPSLYKLTPKQTKNLNKEAELLKGKKYTFSEMCDTVTHIVRKEEENLKHKFAVTYLSIIATTLNAEPYRFGKKRITDIIGLMLDQIDGVSKGYIVPRLIIETAQRLGIDFEYNSDGRINVKVDDSKKMEG